MKETKLCSADYNIFLFKALFWIGVAWLGFASALGGFFYAPAIWTLVITSGICLAYYYIFKLKYPIMPSRELIAVSAISLLAVILFAFFSAPTVFSGRDQGAISEAAIRLAQNHTFEFSTPASTEFFKIYGPGRALNFPGFYYTSQGSLITQFPLVYIVWLALFYSLFGIAGFAVANAILLLVFLISFYLLIRLFLKAGYATPTFIFALTSFSFMWFSKFTLSENMALPLLWLSILALMLFLKSSRKLHYLVFLASAFLLFFTRIEGIAFLAVSATVIFLSKNARKYVQEKPLSRFFLPSGIFLLALVANTFKDLNFYREIAKAFLSEFTGKEMHYLGALTEIPLPAFYFEKIFFIYGLLGFFIVGLAAILFYLHKKQFYKLIPFFIAAPTCIYFFSSQISPDHPWMLRRFTFSLLPAAIFYSGLFIGQGLEKWKYKKSIAMLSGLIALILLFANLPALSKYLTFSENKGLLTQTQAFSNKFSDQDLVLIDRGTTGDGWTMISGPMSFLYGKNSVYFFNTEDLAKLDLQKFSNVYLVAPNQQSAYYSNSTIGNRLTLHDSYSFVFPKLNSQQENPLETTSLPIKEISVTNGKIFEVKK
jgi:hypothetical protein